MLKGIDPLLTPDLLRVLAWMGHGDEIVIADANFTAQALAQRVTGSVPVVHCPGVGVQDMAQAVLSLLPLARDVDHPVGFMQVEHRAPDYRSAQQRAVQAMLAAQGYAQAAQCAAIERFAFYDRVRACQAIVLTGERQPFANLLLRKGVIGEDLVP
jgi:L-fucose mutarotase